MHAYLHSTRLAPKKANLMAKMVRGLTVPDAVELLRCTSKKSARLFEDVLHSAIANAQHNFKQDAQTMIVKTVVVNQGTAHRRGVPMARGRVRPIRKFMCHISLTLGFPGDVTKTIRKHEGGTTKEQRNPMAQKSEKKNESASQAPKKSVKASSTPRAKKSSESSVSSDSSSSSK